MAVKQMSRSHKGQHRRILGILWSEKKHTEKHVLRDSTYEKPQATQNEMLCCLWIPKDEASHKEKQGGEYQHGQAHG